MDSSTAQLLARIWRNAPVERSAWKPEGGEEVSSLLASACIFVYFFSLYRKGHVGILGCVRHRCIFFVNIRATYVYAHRLHVHMHVHIGLRACIMCSARTQ